MSSKIKLYRKFYDPIKANIVREKLVANGIPCFLTNENTHNLGFLNFTNLSINLMLHEADFEVADEILTESGFETNGHYLDEQD
jgi:hypothetical protein